MNKQIRFQYQEDLSNSDSYYENSIIIVPSNMSFIDCLNQRGILYDIDGASNQTFWLKNRDGSRTGAAYGIISETDTNDEVMLVQTIG